MKPTYLTAAALACATLIAVPASAQTDASKQPAQSLAHPDPNAGKQKAQSLSHGDPNAGKQKAQSLSHADPNAGAGLTKQP